MGATAKVVDMSQVKERGEFRPKLLPDGDYPGKVTKVADHKSKAGNPQWLYSITITDGPGKGSVYPYYCGQDADQLWKVRNLFVAAGMNVPKKKVKLDPNKVVGKRVGVTLEEDEPYNGKTKSQIAGFLPIGEVGDAPDDATEDDVEDEGDADEVTPEVASTNGGKKGKKDKKGKKGKKAKTDEAEVTDAELEELEVEEL